MSKSHLDVAHKERPGDSRPASNPIPNQDGVTDEPSEASASRSAITSLAWVTTAASPCLMSSFGPVLTTLVTGPGTAPTRRPRLWAL